MTKAESQYEDLKKAHIRLKEALDLPQTDIYQDATIQRFEFTFETSWKLMNTIVRENGIDVYGPKNTFRAAAKLGFIDDPSPWFRFLEARNYTTHVYDEKTAKWVYRCTKEFLPFVEKLIIEVKPYVTRTP